MVKNRLSEADAKWGYILDGYPRTIRQAEDLDGFAVSPFGVLLQPMYVCGVYPVWPSPV